MSATPPNSGPPDGPDLQFDRAVPASRDSDASGQAVACAACNATLRTAYYDVDGQQLCARCKHDVERKSAPVREWGPTLRASLFGFSAAVAGAIIYYGVIAITNFEIGIVALLIGYMVGFSVRKGAHGRGGRRLQLAAAALTYFSVSLAYLPLAIKGAVDGNKGSRQSASVVGDSTPSGRETPNATAESDSDELADADSASQIASDSEQGTVGTQLAALGMLLIFSLALPVMVVLGSLPSGLISALIIGIGMRQAWTMTRAAEITIAGPFRVGRARTGDAASAGPASTAA